MDMQNLKTCTGISVHKVILCRELIYYIQDSRGKNTNLNREANKISTVFSKCLGQKKRCFTSSKIREGIFLNLLSYSSLRQEEYHMKFSNKTRLINVSNTPSMIRIHPESDS